MKTQKTHDVTDTDSEANVDESQTTTWEDNLVSKEAKICELTEREIIDYLYLEALLPVNHELSTEDIEEKYDKSSKEHGYNPWSKFPMAQDKWHTWSTNKTSQSQV